jgi:hypothetical protein
MYKIYTDKTELFECKVTIEGASLSNSQARLIIESTDLSLLFKGDIDESGNCKIPIKKLKGVLPENVKGEIKLEVIAEDTYFIPWKSEFSVETSKKVTVEIKSQDAQVILESAPKVQVTEVKQAKPEPEKKQEVETPIREHVIKLIKLLVRENINLNNITIKKDRVNNIIATYMRVKDIKPTHTKQIVEGILNTLQK